MSDASPAVGVLVIYGGDGGMRRQADQMARAAGWRTRVASRPAELIKALDASVAQVWLLDTDAAITVDDRATRIEVLQTRTPGETIEDFVSRALGNQA